MNIRNILWYLGVFLLVEGILSILPVIIALYYHEPYQPYLMGVVLSIITGSILMRFPRVELNFGDAMILSSVALIILSFFGALPFFNILNGNQIDILIDGYFESVSGYSTTGLTVLPSDMYAINSKYYHALIFKRTMSEWIGGLGIVILFLSILAKGGMSSVYLYKMTEGFERLTPSVERTARIILRIYIFYTLVGIMLLWVSGLDLFHSLCTVMSTIATGGFIGSVFKINSMYLGINVINQSIIIIIMLIAAVPFTLHYDLLSGKIGQFFNNIEIKALIGILFISIPMFLSFLWLHGIEINCGIIFQTILGTISTITTTGYSGGSIIDGKGLQYAGDIERFLLFILMIIGACAGSTGGGIKQIRLSVMIKAIQWSIRRLSLPESAIVPFKICEKVWSDKELKTITLFFFIYMVIIGLGFSVMILHNIEPMQALLLSSSSLGTNGLSGIDIRTQPLDVKIILIFQMIAGRLEIFPVLALLGYISGKLQRRVIEERDELERRVRFIKRMMEIK